MSPVWCPHGFLTSKDYWDLDFDMDLSIQKKIKRVKCGFRIAIALKAILGGVWEH